MAKRPVPLYDFAAFGQAIKAARTERKESRKAVSDAMNISPRYAPDKSTGQCRQRIEIVWNFIGELEQDEDKQIIERQRKSETA